jgi:hypothetical protein
VAANQQIFDDRHLGKDAQQLKSPRDAEPGDLV